MDIDFWKVYEPLPHQEDVHRAENPIKALMGGFGSGKSKLLAVEALRLSQVNAGYPVGFFGPTYDEVIQKVNLPEVLELLDALEIDYRYHGTKKQLTIPLWDGIIWFFSCHKPRSLKGPTLASAVCDEPGLFAKEAWEIIDTRVREPKAKLLQIVLAGTPEGMNWLFDLLVTDAVKNDVYVRYASIRDNIHLPKKRVEAIYARFPKRTAKMYLEGQFIPLAEAQVYFAYNPTKHDNKKLGIIKNVPLNIGIDFNVRNMHAEINQKIRADVLLPLEITAYETKELGENIYDDLKGYYPWHLYPDASGQYKDSKGISDFEILRQVFMAKKLREGDHFFMHYPAANGRVRDRVNAMNAIMENAKSESHFTMNHLKCPHVKRDLMQVSYMKNSNQIDKSNIDLTHATDAEGYFIDRVFPIKPQWRIG